MTDNEDGEDLFDKTHFYHNEEKYGQILTAPKIPIVYIIPFEERSICEQH